MSTTQLNSQSKREYKQDRNLTITWTAVQRAVSGLLKWHFFLSTQTIVSGYSVLSGKITNKMDRKKNGKKVKKPVRTPHLAPQSILRLLSKIREDRRK